MYFLICKLARRDHGFIGRVAFTVAEIGRASWYADCKKKASSVSWLFGRSADGNNVMTGSTGLEVKCEDFLKDNPHLYAHKAKRKKIALVSVEAAAQGSSEDVTVALGSARLLAAGGSYGVEKPGRIIRRFSEFTWDFLFYLLIDFHPVLALVDVLFLLTGPLYNRRLKKQLRLLSDGEMVLRPGERKTAILGFERVPSGATQLQLWYRHGNGDPQRIECDVTSRMPIAGLP
jgi:hypothetical protein